MFCIQLDFWQLIAESQGAYYKFLIFLILKILRGLCGYRTRIVKGFRICLILKDLPAVLLVKIWQILEDERLISELLWKLRF